MEQDEQLQSLEIQCEVFMDKHDIAYNDLNEELKNLYDALDEALTEYENLDDDANETQARDLLISIEAKDSGLMSKLEPFQKELEEKRKQIATPTPTPAPTDSQNGQNNDNKGNEDKPQGDEMGSGGKVKTSTRPSWRFW